MRSRTREWRCMDTRWKRDALRVAPATAIAQMSVSIEYLLKGGHRARPLRSTVQHREYVPVVQHRDTAHKQTHVAKLRHLRSNRVAIPHRR